MSENFLNENTVFLSRTRESVANRLRINPKARAYTVHSFKGKEAEDIYIEDDLNNAMAKAIMKKDKSEIRLYYVAITRARNNLFNALFCE